LYNFLQPFDKPILYFLNQGINCPLLDFLLPLITRLGENLVPLSLCLLFFIFGKQKGRWTAGLLAIAYLLSRTVALFLKVLTQRPRPFLVYPDLRVMGTADFSSFPSGHAALVTALAVVLADRYKNWKWPLWILVALVGISRVYMGLHYFTDVIAGILIGLAVGYLTIFLKKYYLRLKMGGRER
jgi:undecaprenyl-diphosphatase